MADPAWIRQDDAEVGRAAIAVLASNPGATRAAASTVESQGDGAAPGWLFDEDEPANPRMSPSTEAMNAVWADATAPEPTAASDGKPVVHEGTIGLGYHCG